MVHHDNAIRSHRLLSHSSRHIGILWIHLRHSEIRTENDIMPSTTPKKRLQFSIGGLLIVFLVVAIVLSRFYPRVHATVQIKVADPGQLDVHCMIVRSNLVLSRATSINWKSIALMDGDRIQWLENNIEAHAVGKDTMEIRVVGYPKDREQLQSIVDAVAKSYIKFIDSQRSTESQILTEMQAAYNSVKQEEPSNTQLLTAIDNQIKSLKQNIAKNPPPAKPRIVKRESKMGR
ncbi:MAG: hypothetical protein ACI9G1_004732 [Pirellulaceae bacterium]|jgi:hypothetical protein